MTSSPLRNLSVLIVDDHHDAREILSLMLSDSGAVALTAQSAAQAVAIVETARCDVVITDLGLPDHDGHWLLEQVRARSQDLPVIALTGYPEPAEGSPFAAWLLKPALDSILPT